MNPRSLANLRPGEGFRSLSPDQLKANSVRANAARSHAINRRLERRAESMEGPEALRLGMRVGYNRAYLRWKAYADKRVQEAYQRLA